MKIGDLITFKIDYDSECIEDIGIVTEIEPLLGYCMIAWPWGPERHRTCGLQVLSETGEQK